MTVENSSLSGQASEGLLSKQANDELESESSGATGNGTTGLILIWSFWISIAFWVAVHPKLFDFFTSFS